MESTRMPTKQIIVIGASAGGIDALRSLASGLPRDFPVPICVVVHTSPQAPGILHDILNRAGTITAVNARNGERLRGGHIYVAPPDCHLIVEPGRLRVTKGPKENRFRPAIDPLFRSAAQVYGPRAIGVILTGNLDDGTAGLWTVKQLGGIAIAQDPDDALFPAMPTNASKHVKVDFSVSLGEVAPLLVRLTSVPVEEEVEALRVPEHVEVEVKIAKEQNALDAGLERIATPSSFACPECHRVPAPAAGGRSAALSLTHWPRLLRREPSCRDQRRHRGVAVDRDPRPRGGWDAHAPDVGASTTAPKS